MRARVLIVDDEPEMALEVAEYLEADLGPVGIATSAFEALPRLGPGSTVEVVIVDLRMPGMDGFELIERVQGEQGEASPRFIITTGHGGPAERRKAEALQVAAFIDKPFDLERLRAEVLRCLGEQWSSAEMPLSKATAAGYTQQLEERVDALEGQLRQLQSQLQALRR